MRAYLRFDLPDDNEDYKMHCQTSELHCAIYDFDMWLREYTKYGDPKKVDADSCREKLWELLRERNIELM